MLKRRLLLWFLFSVVLLESNGQGNNCDSIPWSGSRALTWDDFKSLPDTNSAVGALSYNSIKYVLETINYNHYLFVQTYFEPCKSWYKPLDSTLSLEHEQTHFDIDEYIRRSFIKDVLRLTDFSKSALPGIGNLYFAGMHFRRVLHATYDHETNFHRNEPEQKNWSNKIKKMVNELGDFSAHNYLIKEKRTGGQKQNTTAN